nr:hypothetical protein [uncultured Pigmentiphaga sp.]
MRLGGRCHPDHREIGAHLHDGLDIVSVEFADRRTAHFIGSVRDLDRARTAQANVAHDREAAVFEKAANFGVCDREIRRQERDALDPIGIQGRFQRKRPAGHAHACAVMDLLQVLFRALAAIPERDRRHPHHQILDLATLEHFRSVLGIGRDRFDHAHEICVIVHLHVGDLDPAVMVGDADGTHVVEIRLDNRIRRRPQDPEFHPVTQMIHVGLLKK